MSYFATLLLALAATAYAAPAVSPRAAVDDTTVLQYALTLEHLENSFYKGALEKYDEAAFESAGFPSWVRSRFEQIAAHEASHVAFLQTALGSSATKPCEYSFPYTDPKSFAALSMAIEGVGTSAYLGAAQFISEKAYLTAAGSILTVEARHDAWVASAVEKDAAWNRAYDTPLGLSEVFSIAKQFITSCPSTNPQLPVTTVPALTLSPAAPTAGSTVTVNFTPASSQGTMYLAFHNGLAVEYAEIKDGKATVPTDLANSGTVYANVVSSSQGTPTDATTLSGVSILYFGFSSDTPQ